MTSLGLWVGVSGVFSFFIASGNILFGAIILFGMLLFVAMLMGSHLLVFVWLLGQPTIFLVFNAVLAKVPLVTMERVMLFLLGVLMIMRMAFVKEKQTSFSLLEKLIIVFLSYALISLIITTTSFYVRQDLWFHMQYGIPMTMFIISRRIVWSERGVKLLLASMTMLGVFLAISGFLQTFFGVDFFTVKHQAVTEGHTGRSTGTFSSAHTFGATLSILCTLTLLQYSLYRDWMVRLALAGAMFLMALGIVLGQTRAPLLSFTIALFIVYLRDRNVRVLLVSGALIALLLVLMALPYLADQRDLMNRFTNTSTMIARLVTWATAINMIAHNPVFGVGFGSYSFLTNKSEYLTSLGPLPAHNALYMSVPHNEYLHVGVQLGIVGFILFIGILYSLVRLMLGIHMDPESSPLRKLLAVYVAAIVVGLLCDSMFSDTYLQNYFWLLGYFFAGLVAGMPRNCSRSPSNSNYGSENHQRPA